MSALSTGVFLAGSGLTIFSGFRYGKAAGTEQLLRAASQGSGALFDKSGELSREAKAASAAVPGLFGVLQKIEDKAASQNQDVQQTIQDMRRGAHEGKKKQQKLLLASGIAAGAGLVGMLVFISAAKIARHRGLMLVGPKHGRVQAQWAPRLSSQELGLEMTLRF